MEHIVGEPRTETVGAPRKRTVFDMIENPEPGWHTRKLKQVISSDRPAFWRVELMHNTDGSVSHFEAESLFVAWARATEAAHMHNIGLFAKPGLEVATPLSVDVAGE